MMAWPTLPDPELPSLPEGPYEIMIPYSRLLAIKESEHTKPKITNFSNSQLLIAIVIISILISGVIFGFVSGFIFTIFSSLFIYFFFYAYFTNVAVYGAPSHMQIGQEGIRFHWLLPDISQKRNSYRWSTWFSWKAMENVSLVHDKNQKQYIEITSHQVDTMSIANFFSLRMNGLVKHTDSGIKLVIEPDAIVHEPDQTKLLAAFQHFLPSEKIDASMAGLESLSYTKLWLKEFTNFDPRSFASNSLDPLANGTELAGGLFRIVEKIGSGGQSLTYKATMRNKATNELPNNSDRIVVLKEFVLPARAGREIKARSLKHIENEARMLQKLDHPQIVKYIDSFISGNRAYLSTEYIKGPSLRKLVNDQGPLLENATIRIAISMCSILEYLHSLSPAVIHRDFTPENLLLPDDGQLVLIDFNVAQQQESEYTKTVVGKHHYLPPEQFRGNALPQSDIYACGGCIFWLCTGKDPEPLSVSHPKNIKNNISDRLDIIVAKATALSLDERYTTASDMKKDLENLLQT